MISTWRYEERRCGWFCGSSALSIASLSWRQLGRVGTHIRAQHLERVLHVLLGKVLLVELVDVAAERAHDEDEHVAVARPDARGVHHGELARVLLQEHVERVVAHARDKVEVLLVDRLVQLVRLWGAHKRRRLAPLLHTGHLGGLLGPRAHLLALGDALHRKLRVLERLGELALAPALRRLPVELELALRRPLLLEDGGGGQRLQEDRVARLGLA
jgi:hypothetical protein